MPRLLIITEQTVCKTLIKDLSKQKCSDLIVQTKLIEQVQLTCNSKEDNNKDKTTLTLLETLKGTLRSRASKGCM